MHGETVGGKKNIYPSFFTMHYIYTSKNVMDWHGIYTNLIHTLICFLYLKFAPHSNLATFTNVQVFTVMCPLVMAK